MKKCVYCGAELEEDSVVDVCERCGVGVWGRKMFESIKENMKTARKKGDLYQGLVNEDLRKNLDASSF